jgi:hypothetical protein
VDGTGSGSCPMEGFGISGVEPSGSATRELVRTIHRTFQRGIKVLKCPHSFRNSIWYIIFTNDSK